MGQDTRFLATFSIYSWFSNSRNLTWAGCHVPCIRHRSCCKARPVAVVMDLEKSCDRGCFCSHRPYLIVARMLIDSSAVQPFVKGAAVIEHFIRNYPHPRLWTSSTDRAKVMHRWLDLPLPALLRITSQPPCYPWRRTVRPSHPSLFW